MRKDQLEILLKHGDIMTMDFIYKEAPECEKQYFENHRLSITIRRVEYAIGRNVMELLYQLFHSYSSCFIDALMDELKRTITENLKYLPNEKEDKKKLYVNLIRLKNARLEKVKGHITSFNRVENMKASFLSYFMENSISGLITHLKFDILNSKKIDSFNFGSVFNMGKLNHYFFTDELIVVYKTIAFEKMIKYLKELIEDLEKEPVEKIVRGKINDGKIKSKPGKEFKYKAIAIAYIILEIHIDNNTAKNILLKHSQQRSIVELVKAQNENRNLKEVSKSRGNKSADSKHLNSLMDAKWIIISMKNKKAEIDVTRIISSFQANCNNYY